MTEHCPESHLLSLAKSLEKKDPSHPTWGFHGTRACRSAGCAVSARCLVFYPKHPALGGCRRWEGPTGTYPCLCASFLFDYLCVFHVAQLPSLTPTGSILHWMRRKSNSTTTSKLMPKPRGFQPFGIKTKLGVDVSLGTVSFTNYSRRLRETSFTS